MQPNGMHMQAAVATIAWLTMVARVTGHSSRRTDLSVATTPPSGYREINDAFCGSDHTRGAQLDPFDIYWILIAMFICESESQ